MLTRALTEAEQWYKENKELKRRSMLPNVGAAGKDIVDVVDSGDDLQALRKTVIELSENNARLQSELNEAKLNEFEANEQAVNLSQVILAINLLSFLE